MAPVAPVAPAAVDAGVNVPTRPAQTLGALARRRPNMSTRRHGKSEWAPGRVARPWRGGRRVVRQSEAPQAKPKPNRAGALTKWRCMPSLYHVPAGTQGGRRPNAGRAPASLLTFMPTCLVLLARVYPYPGAPPTWASSECSKRRQRRRGRQPERHAVEAFSLHNRVAAVHLSTVYSFFVVQRDLEGAVAKGGPLSAPGRPRGAR